ncbi:MAG: ribosome-associated translation inhibitor RaiA [Firmicutes bacterium]|nr:ribosome-associated translation inhibitor RaiA [Bacillota bacterium]
MKYNYTGRGINVTQRLKDITEKKLERLSKFFTPDTLVYVTFKEEKRTQSVEVTIPTKGSAIRCEAAGDDVFDLLDVIMDKLERQIVKYRKKLIGRAKIDRSFREDYFAAVVEEEAAEEEKTAITRVKTVEVESMDEEEACLQMELTGHDFFAYRDGKSGQICIAYKRKQEGTYGVLKIEG